MEVLKLIKNRRAIRKYKGESISEGIIRKIIEAGRWGPSVVTFQPWQFFVVTNKVIIQQISKIVEKKINEMGVIGKTILSSTNRAIKSSACAILYYTTGEFVKVNMRLGPEYVKLAKIAEISAISAAIQI